MDYDATGPVHKDNQQCKLCHGSGVYCDKVCVRCGGYGSFSKNAPNPKKSTKEEKERYRQ